MQGLCKIFQHHEQQLLHEVGTKVVASRSIFSEYLVQMSMATECDDYGSPKRIAKKHVNFQIQLFDTETKNITCSITDK